jgi:tRNA-modifying protein YgfZ
MPPASVDARDTDARALAELASGAVLHDLAAGMPGSDDDRDVIVATGADRVRFLNGIVTGSVAATPVGGGCHATLLNLKAHVVAELRIFLRETDTYLVVPRGQGAATAAALARYAIIDDFSAEPAWDFALLAVLGPTAGAHLAEVGYAPQALAARPLWSHIDVAGPLGTLWMVRAHQLGTDGYWLGGAIATIQSARAALGSQGLPSLSVAGATAARVAAFEPAWGREISDQYFPMEVGLADTIDYKKGCFLGQEPIVRIRDRGHINWRLVQLQIAGGQLPALDGHLEAESKAKAGKLTTVAEIPGRGIAALALLHASIPVGGAVRVIAADGTTMEATVTRE